MDLRERACACCWCNQPTWNLNAVCNRRRCRAADERYRVRREVAYSAGATTRTGLRAGGPGSDVNATHTALTTSAGAAITGEGLSLLSATDERVPVRPLPGSPEGATA